MAQQNQARFTTHVFTFQYGSTLMDSPIPLTGGTTLLYIPIWFYFNEFVPGLYNFVMFFTFQYGSTLIAIVD